jgi:hypothetical protein
LKAISWRKRCLVIAAASVFILGIGLPVISGAMMAGPTSGEATSLVAASAATPQAAVQPAVSLSPHNGTLDVYETVPGGATTLDPAAAYDVTSEEVLFNTYETLVNYNGSSTATFVPTLATCVPGQGNQCNQDYGGNFTGIANATGAAFTGSNGQPVYWTFVIDPAARFYDPASHKGFPVYPTDVMFSVARTLAFTNLPYAEKAPGWIIAQSLLNIGQSSFNHGFNSPYNNTAQNIMHSMLINDSEFCPASAMGVMGNGCITFIAHGQNVVWPEFLDFVEDESGAAVVSCGWYTNENAGVPGWNGTKPTNHGDGSCVLPNGAKTTNNATAPYGLTTSWGNYLAGLGLAPTYYNAFEAQDFNWPAPQPNVQWRIVASGPYYIAPSGEINPEISYSLEANPDYKQPSGCTGATFNGIHTYTGYCDPATGQYIPKVDVTWETSGEGDSLGTDAILAGTADFAGIFTTHTGEFLSDVHSGLWQYITAGSLDDAFVTINLAIDDTDFNTTFGNILHTNPIPETLFSDMGLRNFYVDSYPYATIQQTINTVEGIEFSFNAGGPIPVGMGNYYPSNVTFPYEHGDPFQGAGPVASNYTTAGEAAWWWAQLTNPLSPYYNATLHADCTSGTPCTWPIGYFDGAPVDQTLINDWAADIFKISNGTLSPWPLSMTFTQFLESLVGPAESPLASAVGFGWGPDYPDPTDYVSPIASPSNAYTAPDAFDYQVLTPPYENNLTCGYYTPDLANLSYWVHAATNFNGSFNSTCQGVAYNVAVYYMNVAAQLPAGPNRVTIYAEIEQITNALAMYVYNGQTNQIIGFAPWISAASVNTNPLVGAGEINDWIQIRYQTGVTKVTVNEAGLTVGQTWGITVNGKFENNTTVIKPHTLHTVEGSVVYFEPAGILTLAPAAAPAGFGTVRVTGPVHTSFNESNVTLGHPVVLTLFFGALRTVSFTEDILAAMWTGLPAHTAWTVTLTRILAGSEHGSLVKVNTTTCQVTGETCGSAVFSVPQGLTYHYAISGLPVTYIASPASGSIAAGAVNVVHLEKFKDPPVHGGAERAMFALPAKLFGAVSTVGKAFEDLAAVPMRGGF